MPCTRCVEQWLPNCLLKLLSDESSAAAASLPWLLLLHKPAGALLRDLAAAEVALYRLL
jgi:hypothetical protein